MTPLPIISSSVIAARILGSFSGYRQNKANFSIRFLARQGGRVGLRQSSLQLNRTVASQDEEGCQVSRRSL